jgi:pyridoxine 5-phosphate synthase
MIEIHTGEYADARTALRRKWCLRKISAIARYAAGMGLTVNAGHGLDYGNTAAVARIGSIQEISIGHAIVVRAVESGFGPAVREMVRIVKKNSG